MARLYYAAFPALVPSATESTSTVPPPSTSAASSHVPNNKESFSTKQCFGNKEQPRSKKYLTKERRNTLQAHRSHNRANKNNYFNKVNRSEELPEWVNDGDEWDIDSQDAMLETIKGKSTNKRHGKRDKAAISEDSTKKHNPEQMLNDYGEVIVMNPGHWFEKDFRTIQKSPVEEESMAKFKAKFDHSLEALWRKEQNNNENYEMPMDFHDINSPSDRMFDCYSADKPLPLSLTSSIWSNNESKFDWENNDIASLNYVQSQKPSSSMINMKPDIWQSDLYNKESMEVIYKKLKPLNLDDSEEMFDLKKSNGNIFNASSKWPGSLEESFSFEVQPLPIGTSAHSYSILNHNSLCSSFTEVIPKAPSGFVGDSLKRKINGNLNLEMSKSINFESNEKDDEDLLTSMRTHFRPIKNDGNDCTQAAVNYADGMTFSIVSDLDSVKFSRTESGTMFLESDSEPPKQYMEYRKQGIDYSRLDICPSSNCSDEDLSSTDLVLKFKVCQSEKYVQTDNADSTVPGKKETEPQAASILTNSSSDRSNISVNVDLKNSEQAQEIDNELDTSSMDWVQCDDCKLNNNQWTTGNWHSFQLNSAKIWSSDESFCKACLEQQAKAKNAKRNSAKNKIFEEESAKEWDEILSDLRYIQDIKSDSDWQEDVTTPSDNCYIAPTEISFQAADGNFIKSALMAQKTENNVIEDVKAWLIGTNGKIESNTVGKILDQSLFMYSNVEPHCEACSESSSKVDEAEITSWKIDRKRRHSAVNSRRPRGIGKLRCTLPAITNSTRLLHMSIMPTADRPLTR